MNRDLPAPILHVHRTPVRHTLVLWAMALLAFGFFEGARWLTTTETGSPTVRGYATTLDPQPTQHVAVSVWLATPDPTAVPSPRPTRVPTRDPYRDLPRCNASPVAGELCLPRPNDPPTPVPWATCEADPRGSEPCRWPGGG